MKVTELIVRLEELREKHGDVSVVIPRYADDDENICLVEFDDERPAVVIT